MKRKLLVLILVAVLSIVTPLFDSRAFANTGVPEVVINRQAIGEKLQTAELSLSQLIDIFTKRMTRWNDGSEIVVITRKQNSLQNQEFLLSVLGLTPYQFKTRLQRNIYKGKTQPPIEVNSEEEMLDILLENDAAIGYMYNYMIIRREGRVVIITVVE